tara:strand:+ start:544 stop:1281 length:738 start_codon:yes stop_codon:yes gene_type:complete
MLKTKLRSVVDDLAKDFKQSFDDKHIQKIQIAHWVIMIGNRLLSQHIAKRDSGAFLSVFPDVEVQVAKDNSTKNVLKNRKFIELPSGIFDYNLDGGVEFMSYYIDDDLPGCPPAFMNQTFTRTSQSEAQRLNYSKYEAPQPKNPYFYRVGDYLYLLGIEKVDVKKVEVGLYSTLKPVTGVSLDDDFEFPEELLIQLKKQVLDLGRFVMVMPSDRSNDGSDVAAGSIPTNKIVSVNELSEDAPNNQ